MLEGIFLVKATYSKKKIRTSHEEISDLWGPVLRTINAINATQEGEMVADSVYAPEDYTIYDELTPLILPYRVGFGGELSFENYLDVKASEFKLSWEFKDDKGVVVSKDYSNSDLLTPTEFEEALGLIKDIVTKGNDSVKTKSISKEGEHIGVDNVDNFGISKGDCIKVLSGCSTYPRVMTIKVKKERYYKVTVDEELQNEWASEMMSNLRNSGKN